MRLLCVLFPVLVFPLWGDEPTLRDISEMARRGKSADIEKLYLVCTTSSPRLAAAAISALRTIPGTASLAAIIRAWEHFAGAGNDDLAGAALRELASIRREDRSSLGRLLAESGDPATRAATLKSWAALDPGEAFPKIAERLASDPAPLVRLTAAGLAFSLRGTAEKERLLERLANDEDVSVKSAIFRSLVEEDETKEDAMRTVLASKEPRLRAQALDYLGQDSPEWLSGVFLELCRSRYSADVDFAVSALLRLGKHEVLPQVYRILATADRERGTHILRAIRGLAGQPDDFLHLLKVGRRVADPILASRCLTLAWELCSKRRDFERFRNQLDPWLAAGEAPIRAVAYSALEMILRQNIRRARDDEWLERGLEDGDLRVVNAAIEGLMHAVWIPLPQSALTLLARDELGDASLNLFARRSTEVWPVVIEGLPHLDNGARARAVQVLAAAAESGAKEPGLALLALLDDSSAVVRYQTARALSRLSAKNELATDATDKLLPLLDDPYFRVRGAAALALASVWPETEPPDTLIDAVAARALVAEPPELRDYAEALESIDASRSRGVLLALAQSASPRELVRLVTVLSRLGKDSRVTEFFGQRLNDPVLEVRVRAAMGVFSWGESSGNAVLVELLEDRRPFVRSLVGEAVKMLRDVTGEDHGFDPFLPLDGENLEAMELWKARLLE